MTALISLISIACLVMLAHIYNRVNITFDNRLSKVEERLRLTQDGELRRMLDNANETIAKLKKENQQLNLMAEIDHMNLYERKIS